MKTKISWTFLKHTLLEKKAINLIIDNSKIEDVEPKEAEKSEETESENDKKNR